MSALAVDPRALAEVAVVIRAIATSLDPCLGELRAVAGRSGDGSQAEIAVLALRLDQLATRVRSLAGVVAVVADGFARTEAGVVATFAPGIGSALDSLSGSSLDSVLSGAPPAALAALLAASPDLARAVVDRTDRLPPGSVAARLDAVQRSGEPATVVLRQARSLLLSLSDDDRRRLALLHPALVSSVASAPVEDRFAACRVLVAAEIARLRTRLPGQVGRTRALTERRLQRYDELLNGRVELVRPDGRRLVRPHQLLAFDPRGDGRIVEVFGDLSVARHLAVFVPGTGTSLDRYDGNAQRVTDFAAADPTLAVVLWQNADFPDQPQDEMLPPIGLWDNPVRAVQHQLRTHVLAAAYRDSADAAGIALTHDVAGLQMAAPGPAADLTVLGHSYGGSIVGSAEAHGLRADRVVQIASAGSYVDDVRRYSAGECGVRRFSMTAPDDPIQMVQGAGFQSWDEVEHSLRTVGGVLPLPLKPLAPAITVGLAAVSADPLQIGHGLDPDRLPGVTRLDTGVRPDGRTLVSGHGGMFEPGSTAWRNLLSVMRGDAVQVLEPERWQSRLVPADGSLPHYVVTHSPYDEPGYQPPVEASTTPTCTPPASW